MANPSLNLYLVCPAAASELIEFEESVSQVGLAPALTDLVRLRVSHLTACPIGVSRHTRRAGTHGVPNAQVEELKNWKAATCFSIEERAAFAWADAVVSSPNGLTPQDELRAAIDWFGDEALIRLTLVIAATLAANVFQSSLGLGGTPQLEKFSPSPN